MNEDIYEEYRADIDDGKDMSIEESMKLLQLELDNLMSTMKYMIKDKLYGVTDIMFHVVEDQKQEIAENLIGSNLHYIDSLTKNVFMKQRQINKANPNISKFKRWERENHSQQNEKNI